MIVGVRAVSVDVIQPAGAAERETMKEGFLAAPQHSQVILKKRRCRGEEEEEEEQEVV